MLRDDAGRTLIPLLIFDQFEEIFTLAQGDDFGRQRAAQFAEDLADLVENRAPKALEAKLDRDEAAMERFDFRAPTTAFSSRSVKTTSRTSRA